MRRFFTLIAFLAFVGSASGQSTFLAGPIGGLNFTKFSRGNEDISGTARPFLGVFAQYRLMEPLSVEINGSYSMRGQRQDQTTNRFEANFLDVHFLLRVHFLKAMSAGTGIGYYHALNARFVSSNFIDTYFDNEVSDLAQLSQAVIPIEVGFQFQNEATLHFTYSLSLDGTYNNPALSFRFPIGKRAEEDQRVRKRKRAKSQIRSLESGALLVRLPTAKPLINALYSSGDSEKAEEIAEEVEMQNQEIVSAFQSLYSFSDVFFFYSDHSKEIANGNFSGLMNAEFQQASISNGDSLPSFFIAEFSNLEPDTARYYIGDRIEPDPEGGLRRVKRYGDSDIGADFRALVIKDTNFVQLDNPFPYYVRSFNRSLKKAPEQLLFLFPIMPGFSLDYDAAVTEMDRKLKRFRKMARTREERKAERMNR